MCLNKVIFVALCSRNVMIFFQLLWQTRQCPHQAYSRGRQLPTDKQMVSVYSLVSISDFKKQ